ncbi:unnamed protein product [Symbiodinium sp. CCMP2456]|nr:unnamed protein product [Symbiodinium sp. CCMP2456]
MGAWAPLVMFGVGFKIVTMCPGIASARTESRDVFGRKNSDEFCRYYGTLRDTNAASDAYGQSGYKTNPVPK